MLVSQPEVQIVLERQPSIDVIWAKSVVPDAPCLTEASQQHVLQACALHKLRLHVGDVSSAFLQTSASEEHQDLTIKVPQEVGYLFPDSAKKKNRSIFAIDEIVLWTHFSTSGVVAGHHTKTISEWMETHVD